MLVGQWRQVGQVAQAEEVQKLPCGHEQMMLIAGDQPALEQGVQGPVAARAADELDASTGQDLAAPLAYVPARIFRPVSRVK